MTKLSVSIKLETKGLDTLTGRAKTMPSRILDVAARNVERTAKSLAPVDTGALRSGIHVEKPAELTRVVADAVEYGVYQELGTSKIAAQPFLTPAVEAERKPLMQAWEAMFKL